MKRSTGSARSGFSLVELLVVIAIISILVALLIPTVNGVIRRTKNARIKLEIGHLTSALEQYKLQLGGDEYPPDFTSGDPIAEINAHLLRKFRYRDARYDVPQNDLSTLDPFEALYFWLRGFSPDPQRPISGLGERTPLFEFDKARLTDRDADGHPEYVPMEANNVPYVYYRKQSYLAASPWAQTYTAAKKFPVPKPYLSEVSSAAAAQANAGSTTAFGLLNFAASEKFQIISAGLDGEFGVGGGSYPGGSGYTPADRDNITNFSQSTTLEDDIP
jgi:prepilin-type N-terminal cleavage/methylation domain-containing protein